MRNVLVAAVALLAAACATSRAAAPLPDAALGLAKGSVFETATPPPVEPDESAPGERPAVIRPYPASPPVIPHGVGGFLPIAPGRNRCVDCHGVKGDAPGGPRAVPASHYVDLRRRPGEAGAEIAGARWVCTTCHVPRTGAKPLVENRFEAR